MSRVLVVEEDPLFRRRLASTLERAGYTVLKAVYLADARELCRRASVDLIVVDLCVAHADQLDTVRGLRLEFPAIKVLAFGDRRLSGPRLRAAKRFGVTRILVKPLDVRDFLGAVEELMELRQSQWAS